MISPTLAAGESASDLVKIRAFWAMFLVAPLYDAGYSDTVAASGIDRARSTEDIACALAYIQGAAATARLASPHMRRHWRVADQIATTAGQLRAMLADPRAWRAAYPRVDVSHLVQFARAEILDVLKNIDP